MKKIQVYTAITGNFEPYRDDITVFRSYDRFKSDRMNAKIYKVMPHLFLDSEITIWLDGNIRVAPGVDIDQFVNEFLGDADIAVFKHPWRSNPYQEGYVCLADRLDDPQIIDAQMRHYFSLVPEMVHDLAECGVIVRRNIARVNAFNESWWAQICRYSSRDQLSFPFVCDNHPDMKVIMHQGNVREDSRFIYTKRQSSKS